VRARDGGILSEGDAAAAVTADIRHNVTDLMVVAGAAALAGVGGGDLIFFAGHFEAVVLGRGWVMDGWSFW
jgi:acyl CoA:acetate/3-ketoacid CoA transferase alpha subunit